METSYEYVSMLSKNKTKGKPCTAAVSHDRVQIVSIRIAATHSRTYQFYSISLAISVMVSMQNNDNDLGSDSRIIYHSQISKIQLTTNEN